MSSSTEYSFTSSRSDVVTSKFPPGSLPPQRVGDSTTHVSTLRSYFFVSNLPPIWLQPRREVGSDGHVVTTRTDVIASRLLTVSPQRRWILGYTGHASIPRNENSTRTEVIDLAGESTPQAVPTAATSLGRRVVPISRLILDIAKWREIVELRP